MAYAKKTTKASKADESFQKLKADLSAGTVGNAYIFYGEESYLREYYLGELRKKLVPAGFEEFNYHALEGKDTTVQALGEMAEAMPMLSERTLLTVTDMDLFKLPEEQREQAAQEALDILKAKKEIQEKDAEIDREGKIAGVFCKAYEKAVLLDPTEENVRIWAKCTRMTRDEMEDMVKESRELAEVFRTIADLMESLLPERGTL